MRLALAFVIVAARPLAAQFPAPASNAASEVTVLRAATFVMKSGVVSKEQRSVVHP